MQTDVEIGRLSIEMPSRDTARLNCSGIWVHSRKPRSFFNREKRAIEDGLPVWRILPASLKSLPRRRELSEIRPAEAPGLQRARAICQVRVAFGVSNGAKNKSNRH